MDILWIIYGSGWWYTYPSEKYESQLGWLFPMYGKIKNVPNHQPDLILPICEPWCWYIYLQNWVIFWANVGKYSIHGAYGLYDTLYRTVYRRCSVWASSVWVNPNYIPGIILVRGMILDAWLDKRPASEAWWINGFAATRKAAEKQHLIL